MKALLIGNGFISEVHRNAYMAFAEEGKDIELIAICDVRPEMLEKNSGQRLYTDVDEMLARESEADFVDICVPTYLHAEMAIKCMKAGFHVLCEKPMSLTSEDCEKMLACSKETGKRLMIAQCSRFGKDMIIMKNFIDEGSFGKPVSAFFVAADGQPTWGFENWFADGNRSGGCMLDLQAHTIDLINWYFGVPNATSTVAKQCAPDFTGYGSISSNLIYDSGLFVHVWCDWGIRKNKHDSRMTRINFENGYVVRKTGENGGLFAVSYEDGSITDISDRYRAVKSGYRDELEYFADCIKSGAPFTHCPPEESANVIRVMRAQEKSADGSGVPIRI
ncbi:MAG: Gfo/Idh/MocA family oxidoreductase [Clostridia bacterium]|nr:Gfo/Idh/MocA family oxidoreductase [Clostridia bacterium]